MVEVFDMLLVLLGHWRQLCVEHFRGTDESRFSLRSPDGRRRVWRRQGERYSSVTVVQNENFWGGSVMVWAGIWVEAKTELFILQERSLNANNYISDILADYVVPFALVIGPEFLLMQDNARPHTARCVMQYLQEVGITTLEWPAMSPDMNPIEHAWDELGRRVRARPVRPKTLQELRQALVEEWENIDQNVIDISRYATTNSGID
ncbi:Transposable element Tc3 transposase-like Protein [Tribolium castaneum]|uniref:Transposable element Tc3 transposase-like Protein n=1 Tax=Tribolium castaneum TaxID=7070 RepID=D2A2Q9_TRICA|nr:Transposable element Tc3 transposase-like Protein [Tribolium castaneum]